MATNVYGVEAFEYVAPSADGSMPTTGFKKVSPIADEAVTLNIPAAAVNNIRAQDVPGIYEVLPGDTDPAEMQVSQLQVNGQTVVDMLGGTWDSVTKRYDAPAIDVINKMAVRLTSKPLNGKKMYFWIRKGAVISNIAVQFVRNDLVKVGFTVRAVTPIDPDGVPQSPWGFQEIDVVQTT